MQWNSFNGRQLLDSVKTFSQTNGTFSPKSSHSTWVTLIDLILKRIKSPRWDSISWDWLSMVTWLVWPMAIDPTVLWFNGQVNDGQSASLNFGKLLITSLLRCLVLRWRYFSNKINWSGAPPPTVSETVAATAFSLAGETFGLDSSKQNRRGVSQKNKTKEMAAVSTFFQQNKWMNW